MHTIKLAVIGAGLIGRRHARIAVESPRCRLVALCDTDRDCQSFARELGSGFYTDLEEMIDKETPDGVIIATPTELHAEVGSRCAERRMHLLVEKPIASSLEQACRLVEAADRNDVQLMVGHHRRFSPLIQTARDIVQRGELGRLVAVSALWLALKPGAYFETGWRTRPGGGPVLINLIHDIDSLRYICGEIDRVYGETSAAVRGLEVEDTASVVVHFENGALGTIILSDAVPSPWSYEATAGENPAFFNTNENCYHFFGTEASLTFPRMEIWRYENAGKSGWQFPLTRKARPVEPQDPLVAQLDHFCQVIAGEESPRVTGRDAVKTLSCTIAVFEACRKKAAVNPEAPIPGRPAE